MNKTKILSIIVLIIAFILIGTGYSMMFIDEYNVDAQKKESYVSLIKTSFTSYNYDLEKISYEIKGMDIFHNKYYEDIKNNYEKNINQLTEIGMKLKNIETISETLLHECKTGYYKDVDHKCDVLEHNYESIINAYVSLTKKYNDKFNSYNIWINNKEEELMLYDSKYYNSYIDINLDGEYSGIIE